MIAPNHYDGLNNRGTCGLLIGRLLNKIVIEHHSTATQFQTLVDVADAMPDGIAIFDPSARLIFALRVFRKPSCSITEPLAAGISFGSVVRQALGKYPRWRDRDFERTRPRDLGYS